MSFLGKSIFRENRKIFLFLISIDAVISMLHLVFGRSSSFFHLDAEQNLPTFYQSLKLIVFGCFLFFSSFSRRFPKETKLFVFPLSFVLVFWGIDEGLQIHENIYRIFEFLPWLHPSKIVTLSMQLGYRSSLWILYYIPFIFVFVLWCGYWLRVFQTALKSNFGIIAVSVGCLFTVLLAELISSTGLYSESLYFVLVTVEEIAEMLLASTLIFVSLKAGLSGLKKE